MSDQFTRVLPENLAVEAPSGASAPTLAGGEPDAALGTLDEGLMAFALTHPPDPPTRRPKRLRPPTPGQRRVMAKALCYGKVFGALTSKRAALGDGDKLAICLRMVARGWLKHGTGIRMFEPTEAGREAFTRPERAE